MHTDAVSDLMMSSAMIMPMPEPPGPRVHGSRCKYSQLVDVHMLCHANAGILNTHEGVDADGDCVPMWSS